MWRIASASVPGTSHLKSGKECQDYNVVKLVESGHSNFFIAVVADGAGSATFGGEGALVACEAVAGHLEECLVNASFENATSVMREAVAAARSAVLDAANARGISPRQMACTVLSAAVGNGWAAFAQLGDGAIVAAEPGSEEWSWIFWPDRGEYANTTYFLTDEAALERVQLDATTHPLERLSLFTDGLQHLVLKYDEQAVHSPFFEQMMQPVRDLPEVGWSDNLNEALSQYLASPSVTSKADDDLTLVLATRAGHDTVAQAN